MEKELVLHGLYSVKEKYFRDFRRPYWMDNKNESRPYYYLLKDQDGVDWLIPMSTQVENYQRKIEREEAKRGEGNCVYYHIGEIAAKPRAFLIGDMFPVDPSYVKAPFVIHQVHYIVRTRNLNEALYRKSMRFLNLVASGKIKSRNDIMGIKRVLLNRKREAEYMI